MICFCFINHLLSSNSPSFLLHMSIPADLYKLLVTAWYHNTIVQYASVSAVTFYLYDYTLTLKDEVEYFWKSRLTPIKVLFLVNRYLAMVLAIVNAACTHFYLSLLSAVETVDDPFSRCATTSNQIYMCVASALRKLRLIIKTLSFRYLLGSVWHLVRNTPFEHCGEYVFFLFTTLETPIMAAVTVVLQFRVHALYNQNKIVLFVVSALFVVEVGSMCVIGGLYAHVRLQTPAVPIPGTPFCQNSTTASYLFAFQIPLIGFEFILLCLVLFKGILHYRILQDATWSTSRILSVLLRDSVLYFLSIFAVLLINTIMWEVGPPTLFPLAATWPVGPSITA
ncbi:hypothetical protein D9615_008544 [Tricholomella constricta]|uniref:DUF6533 domain-containing protein n=1 Tax=Tricholomella constricta TaxID=117010 RepID=A0A8H5H4F1_9AGAR|nr:hypothetical protein D9615_008544 [Tricholomella constricta]